MKNKLFEHGCIYHVFNRGNNKEDIFKEAQNYTLFLNLMKKYLLPVADVYAYCLMKNHYHLVVRIKEKDEILNEKWKKKPYLGFSHMFNSYTQSINKSYLRSGSLFQEHLKREQVTSDDYLIQLIAYVHLNPIKHGFSQALNYPYSSYNAIVSKKKTNLLRNEVLEYFEDVENFLYWHDLKRINLEEILRIEDEDE